ncbi:MAG TPA: hypothetical protein VIP11_21190 [Gemmatimonadaceae bacterium]
MDYGGDFFPAAALAFGPVRRQFNGQPRMFSDAPLAAAVPSRAYPPPPTATVAGSRVTQSHYLGDAFGLLGLRMTWSRSPARVRVVVDAPDLASPSMLEVQLADSGATYELFPEMLYNDRALKAIAQPVISNVAFRVFVNDTLIGERTQRVQVRATSDVPYAYRSRQGLMQSQPWLFATFVNEYDPVIDVLLQEALATRVVMSFDGYQSNQPQQVTQQVFAIWNVLQRRGIRYSSIATAVPTVGGVYSQSVRALRDALGTAQANCVDGSVLFASVLRRIGVDAFLVLQPGHMYVGYYRDPQHMQISVLETTMLGSANLKDFAKDGSLLGGLSQALGADTKNSASAKTFDAAIASAADRYNRAREASKGRATLEFQIIDIAQARAWGLAPAR